MHKKVFVCTLSFNCYPSTATVIEAIKRAYLRENIVLCVADNASTDRMKYYHEKHQHEYDIFIQNPKNYGTMFAINQQIKAFMATDCEFMIYHEGDAIPYSYRPAETLDRIVETLQRKLTDWPRVIGFEMARWPSYPLEDCFEKEATHMDAPISVSDQPLPLPEECQYRIPQVPEEELQNSDIESKQAWNKLMEGTLRPAKDSLFASTSTSFCYPLWMSLAIHRSVWEKLGYFDESDQHGDQDFYRRIRKAGWDIGVSSALKFMANDFQYNQYYMDQGRWKQLELYRSLENHHQVNVMNAAHGQLYRGSIFDPFSIERYNPEILGKSYETWAQEHKQFFEGRVQIDCSLPGRSWLSEDSPKFPQWAPKLIGKLKFIGDEAYYISQ